MSCEDKPSIVGSHGFNFTLFTNVPERRTDAYGVFTFHEDHTFIFHASEFLTQSVGGSPGAYNTVLVGVWKQTSGHKYKAKGEFVQLMRDPSNLAAAAVPMYRWKVKMTLKMNHDGVEGSFKGVATPHPVNDLTLTLPAPAPFTGLVLEVSGVNRKLTSC